MRQWHRSNSVLPTQGLSASNTVNTQASANVEANGSIYRVESRALGFGLFALNRWSNYSPEYPAQAFSQVADGSN